MTTTTGLLALFRDPSAVSLALLAAGVATFAGIGLGGVALLTRCQGVN